jgi:hypothetical protein
MTCTMCSGRGVVFRALVEGGHAMWNDPPEVVGCPKCYVDKLTGAA